MSNGINKILVRQKEKQKLAIQKYKDYLNDFMMHYTRKVFTTNKITVAIRDKDWSLPYGSLSLEVE